MLGLKAVSSGQLFCHLQRRLFVSTPYLTCDNSFNFVFLNAFLQLLMKHFLVSEVSLRMHNKTAMHVKAGFLSRCCSSRFVVRDGGLSNTDSSSTNTSAIKPIFIYF